MIRVYTAVAILEVRILGRLTSNLGQRGTSDRVCHVDDCRYN